MVAKKAMIRGPRGIEGRNWAMRKPRVMVVRRCHLGVHGEFGLHTWRYMTAQLTFLFRRINYRQ